MFRHIVIFTWMTSVTDKQKARTLEELNKWKETAREFGTVQVGANVRLAAGNGDVAVVADFASEADYASYTADSRHQQLIRDHIKPILAERVAVQCEI